MPNLDQLLQAMEANPLLAHLREVADNAEQRVPATRTLRLYDYTPSDKDADLPLVPAGSIALFLGRPGSDLLAEIRSCVREGSSEGRDLELAARLRDVYAYRDIMPMEAAVELLLRQDVIADLTYDGRPLVSNGFVPEDLDVTVFPLPYNGGTIDADAFRLVQRTNEGDGWLDGFLAVHRPNLTDAEAAALSLLPRESAGTNVGNAAMCYAITGIVIVGAVMGATYACPGVFEEPHLDDDIVKRIGPEATARELLSLRRRALERRL